MGEPFLIELTGKESVSEIKAVSYFRRILISTNKYDDSLSLLLRLSTSTVYVDAVDFQTHESITLLDSGASKVFVTLTQFRKIVEESLLEDLNRLVVKVDDESQGLLKELDSIDLCVPSINIPARERCKSYLRLAGDSVEGLKSTLEKHHIPIVPAACVTTREGSIFPETLISSCLKSDREDGLYTTVVVNERGICLGLVYSSKESIRQSLEKGMGVYQSRQRGLWFKGATSGDTQELLHIGMDCDGDALLFTVRQNGDGKTLIQWIELH